MTSIREITNKNEWEKFILSCDKTPFFQSWYWGEVQKRCGFDILRLGIFCHSRLQGIAQIITVDARRGRFYWIRHGPVMNQWSWEYLDKVISTLKLKAKKDNTSFVRISPLLKDKTEARSEFLKRGFRNAPIHNLDAENSLVIDITKSDEDLMRNMRKSTRYLVRKALRMGITIEANMDKASVSKFLELYSDTAKRQNFVPHKGIEEEFKILGKKDYLRLFLAYYKKTLVAGSIIILYGKEAVYHHSAMRKTMRHIPASYLIQWEAMHEAKNRGMKNYNMWGITPPDRPDHPWRGLTLFKTGFGGERINHIHAQDLPFSLHYWFTWVVESARRIKRGY